MIDVNRWFGGLAGASDQDEQDPVRKALALLSPTAGAPSPADSPSSPPAGPARAASALAGVSPDLTQGTGTQAVLSFPEQTPPPDTAQTPPEVLDRSQQQPGAEDAQRNGRTLIQGIAPDLAQGTGQQRATALPDERPYDPDAPDQPRETGYRLPPPQLASGAAGEDTPSVPIPQPVTSTYNDPTAGGTISTPLPPQPPPPVPSAADDPGGARFRAEDSQSTPPPPSVSPYDETPPVVPPRPRRPVWDDPTHATAGDTGPDTSGAAPTSTQVPVWDDQGNVVGYRQQAPAQRQVQQRQADGYGQVQAMPGEPDHVETRSPLRRAVDAIPQAVRSAEDYVLTNAERGYTATGAPINPATIARTVRDLADQTDPAAQSERMLEIQVQAARDLGLGDARVNPALGFRAVRDAGWRAANPELAAEYDDLDQQLMQASSGQVGDVPNVLGRAGKALAESAIPAAREAGAAVGRGARALAEEGAGRLLDLTPQPSMVQRGERTIGRGGAPMRDAVDRAITRDIDPEDLAADLRAVGAQINSDGTVTLYHRTSPEGAAGIERSGVFRGQEDGIFFSTRPDGQTTGYGDAVVEARVPLRDLTLDDLFGDEAHLRVPTVRAGVPYGGAQIVRGEPPSATIATRGSAARSARRSHTPEAGGSSPSPATNDSALEQPAERQGVQLLGSGFVPEGGGGARAAEVATGGRPSADISPVSRQVMDTYRAITPQRVEASTGRTLQIVADSIAGKIPRRGGLSVSPSEIVRSAHEALVRNLQDTKVVATGLRQGAIEAFLRGEGITSKVETGDLAAINRITQGQVNVAGGRAKIINGKKQKVPYSLEDAADFAQRESLQMEMATGGTRFPDPETGRIDQGAPRVNYAYVTEGQPLVGPNRPNLWLIWDDETPRITTAHHAYALGSPGQDIHAGMPPGLKAAIWAEDTVHGGRVAPGIMEGGRLVEAAPGVPETSPVVTGWQQRGIDIGGGRKIAQTNWLVGPDGEDAMRANGLLLSMPQKVQQQIARGELTDPEQIAAVLMRGGPPQWKSGWSAAVSAQRSESLILDPSLEHVKAIYLTATPKNLAERMPNTGGTGRKVDNLTELQIAQRMRQEIQQQTGRDVPIIFNDISQAGAPRAMADAQVLEGPPLTLAPGRGRVVDQYTKAIDPSTGQRYADIGAGFVPSGSTLRNAAQGAFLGAASEDLQAQQEDRAPDPTSRLVRGAMGAGLAMLAGSRAARGALREGEKALGSGFVPFGQNRGSGGTVQAPGQSANQNIRNVARMMSGQYQPVGTERSLGERVVAALTDRYAIHANVPQEARARIAAAGGQQPIERLAERVRENPNSIAAQRNRETLAPALQSVGDDADWLAQYLVHRHNLDIAKGKAQDAYDAAIQAGRTPQQAQAIANRIQSSRMFSGGMTEKDITQALSDMQTEIGPQRFKAVVDAAQAFWKSGQENLDRKVSEGILTQADAQYLKTKYPHYVRTDIADYAEKGPANPSPGGKALGIGNQGIKPISVAGTSKDRVNPILSTIDATYATENAITRNKAARDLVAVRDADPTTAGLFREVAPDVKAYRSNQQTMVPPDYTLRNGEQKMTQWENGVARQFVIPAEYAQLLTPNPGALLGDTASPVRTFFGIMKSLITTHNPAFQYIVSPVRDVGDALVSMQTAAGAAARRPGASKLENTAREAGGAVAALPEAIMRLGQAIPQAFEGFTTNSFGKRAAELRKAGMGFEGRPSGEKNLRDAMRELQATGGIEIKTPGDALRIGRTILSLGAERVGNRLEMVPRIAAANMERARGGDTLTQSIAGKDATVDFLRGGWLTRQLNVPMMYLNPTVQAAAQNARLYRKSPAAFTAALITTVGIPALLSEAWNRSDPERAKNYEDRPDYLSNTGIVWEMPNLPQGTGPLKEKLPNFVWQPLGNHAFAARLAREALGLMDSKTGLIPPTPGPASDRSDPSYWAHLGAEILGMFSPVKGGDVSSSVASLIPPVASEAIEAGANRDLYTGATIATDRNDERASNLSKGIANTANRLLGTEWRPSQVEHAISGPTGYAGQLARAASDLGREKDQTRPIQDIPVVGGMASRIIRDSGGQRLQDERDATFVSPAVRQALKDAGLRSDEITMPSSNIRELPITRQEQAQYQRDFNAAFDRGVREALADPDWQTMAPAERERWLKNIAQAARRSAGASVLDHWDDPTFEFRADKKVEKKTGTGP